MSIEIHACKSGVKCLLKNTVYRMKITLYHWNHFRHSISPKTFDSTFPFPFQHVYWLTLTLPSRFGSLIPSPSVPLATTLTGLPDFLGFWVPCACACFYRLPTVAKLLVSQSTGMIPSLPNRTGIFSECECAQSRGWLDWEV